MIIALRILFGIIALMDVMLAVAAVGAAFKGNWKTVGIACALLAWSGILVGMNMLLMHELEVTM